MTRRTTTGPRRFLAVLAMVAGIVSGMACGGANTGVAKSEPIADAVRETLPVGSQLPSDGYCAGYARQAGSDREAVPENAEANHSEPVGRSMPAWPDFWDPAVNRAFVPRIDGDFMGTTDQIIVWAACKWGVNADLVRAMAMEESSWRQAKVGDFVDDPALCVGGASVPCPTSFGLLQLKHTTRPGSWPDSQLHTAFNVDYSLAVLRGCFEGWVTYLQNGYGAGDLWGCVGWHFSGEWNDELGRGYQSRVQQRLADRSWTD